MKKIILFFTLFVLVFIPQEFVDGCFATTQHHVHVLNNLNRNSSLRVHCASGDDDLGFHTLFLNEKLEWEFCKNFFSNTLFFCHFWWGAAGKAFEVYNEKFFEKSTHDAWWVVKNDGFYFGSDPQPSNLKKKFEWN